MKKQNMILGSLDNLNLINKLKKFLYSKFLCKKKTTFYIFLESTHV